MPTLIQAFRFQRNTLFASGLLLPVLLNPCFPTLAGSSIATAESQGSDIGIRYGKLLHGILRDQPDYRLSQRCSIAAIEDVALDARSIFPSDGNVAAIVECGFQSLAQFSFGSPLRNPALNLLTGAARHNFQGVHGQVMLGFAHARVSSSLSTELPICTSGLKVCTGRVVSFNIAAASSSL